MKNHCLKGLAAVSAGAEAAGACSEEAGAQRQSSQAQGSAGAEPPRVGLLRRCTPQGSLATTLNSLHSY